MTKKEKLRQKRLRDAQNAELAKVRLNPFDTRPKTARKKREETIYTQSIHPYHKERIAALKAIPSVDTGNGNTEKKESQQYTGDLVKGIATMHKSNAVPVLGEEDATEISRMRR